MKRIMVVLVSALFLFSTSVSAEESELQINFLQACDSSPVIGEGSNCMCVFNEVVHKFGNDDAKELIPFISGDQEMEKDIGDSLNYIAGKCES